MQRTGLLLSIGVLAVLLAACASNPDDDTFSVGAVDDEFAAATIRVPVGGTVTWTHLGANVHNVTAADGSWASDPSMTQGDTYVRTFDAPGTYAYYCTIHGTPDGRGMAGFVLVGDDAVAPAEAAGPAAVDDPTGVVRNVPADFPDIQSAVDAADPGDLVLVAPGVYHESVTVITPSLTIRGADRNRTILDGDFERTHGIQVVEADGVAVENLTVRHFTLNGVYWTGVIGYRGSYITAYNNGDYGVYAFNSVDGVFEDSYASGHPDSGFYIGQCIPCNATIRRVISENNALGYSGTNAGGDLYLIESIWRYNRAGVAPNTLDSELNPPHGLTTIASNLVYSNNNREAPTNDFGRLAHGVGIVLAGGIGDVVRDNLVVDHDRLGIAATAFVDDNLYFSHDAEVRDNVVAESGWADLALIGPFGKGNCFEGNRAGRTFPPLLQQVHACDGLRLPLAGDATGLMLLMGITADVSTNPGPTPDWKTAAAPPPQPQMPDAGTAPARPAHDVFEPPDLDSLTVPAPDDLVLPTRAQEVLMTGLPVSNPNIWQLLFGLWGFFLPFAVFASWIGLAIWDLARRKASTAYKAGWLAAVLIIPFVGALAYHLFARSHLPRWFRLAITVGAVGAYIVVLGIGAVAGGVV